MKRKLLSLILIGIVVIGLTGCGNNNTDSSSNDNNTTESKTTKTTTENTSNKGDNPELIDALNGYVSDAEKKWEEEDYVSYFSLDHINDIVKNLDTWKYEFIALGNKQFTGTYTITEWTNKNEDLPNYDGKLYFRTVDFTSKDRLNAEGKYYLLIYDETNESYYNILISFEDFKIDNDIQKDKIYPVFSNSTILK